MDTNESAVRMTDAIFAEYDGFIRAIIRIQAGTKLDPEDLYQEFYLALLRKLRVPTVILAWEGDTAHPVSTATQLAEILPDVRDLVICDPGDIRDWETALLRFIKQMAAVQRRPRRPVRSKRAAEKRKRRRVAA
mgnify:CR=1 FL=1